LVGKTIEAGAICINYKNGFRILMNWKPAGSLLYALWQVNKKV
jgi:hypothetical protein